MSWREDVKGVYGIDGCVYPCFYTIYPTFYRKFPAGIQMDPLTLAATLHVQPENMLCFWSGRVDLQMIAWFR
jgi:hypothetical protein